MYGLVLEGGGAKGSYEIGAYKALHEANVPIGGIAGTSIGALNGALLVQGDFERIYDLWYNIEPKSIFDLDDSMLNLLQNLKFSFKTIKQTQKQFKLIIENKGIDTSKFTNLLKNYIDENKIRESKMEFGIVTISLSDLRPMEIYKEDIPQNKLFEYLLASANFPAFKNERRDGKYFTDGGMYNNLPVNLMIDKGFTDIIAIRIFGMGRVKKFRKNDLNIRFISPKVPLCNTLDFSNKSSRYNLSLGYYDALKVLYNLKGDEYYIDYNVDKDFHFNWLLSINEKKIRQLGTVLGLKGKQNKRMLFEDIIPRYVKLLNLKKTDGYEELFIKIIEYAASELKIEKFKVYKYTEFSEMIINMIKKNKEKFIPNEKYNKEILKLITPNYILPKAARTYLIDSAINILL